MKKNRNQIATWGLLCTLGMVGCQSSTNGFTLEHQGDTLTVMHIANPTKYVLFPIQESAAESQVTLVTGSAADIAMDIRLAVDSIEYYVPFALPAGSEEATVSVRTASSKAITWNEVKLSDTFNTENTDYYRPLYHHTALYGWMNDPNGLVYKDGEYHLYFQYNPYGSRWGNMHWGHSVSKDLIHWSHLDPAIARDTLGHIFSGSTVIDKNNTAGYGNDAMIALYTSASDKGQVQSLAYSTDNGRTYTKYEKNPVLTPFDGLKDFRDPKVFWYEPASKWYMIVSADREMRFYSSPNLKEWEYVSAFGEGYGIQPNQFECPDFIQLAVDGDETNKKWVMIVNINPGCLFGGSATEYFVGNFDGHTFTCDTKPEVTKWLDWGKDHYAAVCISNVEGREIAIPWMSNWQYANFTPIRQYRGANGLPRELKLYTKDGETFLSADVVKESRELRKESRTIESFEVVNECIVDNFLSENEGAYELEFDVTPGDSRVAGLELYNTKGEKTLIYLDLELQKLVMDRTESGLTAFGEKSEPHFIENHDNRKSTSINYKNDFALATWAPLSLCHGKSYHLDIFVDRCSVEIFVDGGRIAMTNLIFPTEPYNNLRFYTDSGTARVENLTIYRLGL
ncbi:MAG: GH32 C-terminal domain-containing protein [Phocaeicola sp.]